MPNIFVVDIETRPTEAYVWGLRDQNVGLSQVIRPGGLLMFAAQERGKKRVETHAEWNGYEDMVKRSWEIYDAADYIVTYNGASFDNKHFKAAWAELGLTPPSPWRDIDLYRTVRKFQWPSRKLAFVCKQLGLDHKTDPGGFETWDHILRGTDEQKVKAQRRMSMYCANDVRITAQLFERLLPWVDGLNVPLYVEADKPACTRCGSEKVQRRGWAYTTTLRYARFACMDCGGWMRSKSSESHPAASLRAL